jgi:hypothetical protein
MMGNFAIPEQSCQQRQSVLCHDRVHEAFLPFKSFHRAATWFSVVVEGRISHLRIEFGDGPQPRP